MKIRDLKLFKKVVELGSFTAAANALDLPRANVSRRISDLESSVGTFLFHRTTRTLSLTNQGEIYYREILKALDILNNVDQTIHQKGDRITGKIKLGILSETDDLLQPILFDFLDQYPDINLEVRIIQNGFIDMYQQGLDIAFHGGELMDSDLVARKVLQLERCLVASPKYLDRNPAPKSVKELTECDVACFRWPTGEIDNRWHFADEVINVQSKMVSNSLGFLKAASLAGRGIAFLPKMLVMEQLESGELVSLLDDAKPRIEDCYLLYPQPKTLSTASRLLIDYLTETIPKLYN